MSILDKIRLKPSADWEQPFDTLRNKWGEVPTTRAGRIKTTELLKLSDEDLLKEWSCCRLDITTGTEFGHRGWYHVLYSDILKGKKVLDVGSGFAIDSITYAQNGAKVTFVDIVQDNLRVVKRLCDLLHITNVEFLFLRDIDSLKELASDYDVIYAAGSLHHAPSDIIKPEAKELLKHLKYGGRWIQLAYPYSRWLNEGKLPFDKWGKKTDGVGTPWTEWYDVSKLLKLLEPAKFDVVFCQEFHDNAFIWFDLIYREGEI
jgi:2-polyprenyl-3-methyl-5-hydroxy-6-metoxy-1,4-benzoquinol methylase